MLDLLIERGVLLGQILKMVDYGYTLTIGRDSDGAGFIQSKNHRVTEDGIFTIDWISRALLEIQGKGV